MASGKEECPALSLSIEAFETAAAAAPGRGIHQDKSHDAQVSFEYLHVSLESGKDAS